MQTKQLGASDLKITGFGAGDFRLSDEEVAEIESMLEETIES